MKRTMLWTMCLLAVPLCAQVAPPPKYKVATAAHEEEIVPLLNSLAEQGYRLIVPGPVMIFASCVSPFDRRGGCIRP